MPTWPVPTTSFLANHGNNNHYILKQALPTIWVPFVLLPRLTPLAAIDNLFPLTAELPAFAVCKRFTTPDTEF